VSVVAAVNFARDANCSCRLAAWLDMIAGDEREEL
jgi:hypothetical protein